jgi:peroxiredoxin
MKRALFLFTVFFAFALTASAQGLAVGGKMENFSLADINGKMQSLNDLKGSKGSVVIFVSSKCPVVGMYNERINQIATDYKAKGINMIGINSNVNENGEMVKTHAELTYKFPILIDKNSTGKSISEAYLRTAFDASLAGRKIEKTSVAAIGCTIKRASDL